MPETTSTIAYVGLGANLGERDAQIRRALRMLEALQGTDVVAVSSLYATEPRIVEDQPEFLNACAKIETRLRADKLMCELLEIERRMGRRRGEDRREKGARRIDLDLLLYGESVIDRPGLRVPHPGLPDRAFVLVPLAEIAAEAVHPEREATVAELLEQCEDTGGVRRR